MRLNQKFTLAFSLIAFFTLIIGVGINYVAVTRSAEQAEIATLKTISLGVREKIKNTGEYEFFDNNNLIRVEKVSPENWATKDSAGIRYRYAPLLTDTLDFLEYTAYARIAGAQYKIITMAPVIRPKKEYVVGLIMVFVWTFTLLIALVIVLSQVISLYILDPFQKTLLAISGFDISKSQELNLKRSTTYEFNELNTFIEATLKKSRTAYVSIQEFSENASHELQTPVAVMQAKIDMLMQTELTEKQLLDLISISDELLRLSSVQKSLMFLTRLDHFNITDNEINLSNYLRKSLSRFEDLVALNELTLETDIADNVYVRIDEVLIKVLHNNLITNAISHNFSGGHILVTLRNEELLIQNTGRSPSIAPEKLFDRFQKSSSSHKSSGIGLSIVRKITDLYGYEVIYTYKKGIHYIRVYFKRRVKELKWE